MVQINQLPSSPNRASGPTLWQKHGGKVRKTLIALLAWGALWYAVEYGSGPTKKKDPVNMSQSAEKPENSGSAYDVDLNNDNTNSDTVAPTHEASPKSNTWESATEDVAPDRDDNLSEEEKAVLEKN